MTNGRKDRGCRALGAAMALAAWLLPAAALGAAGSAPLRLLAFGDSLVHGYGLAAEDAFPAQLERALRGEGYRVEVLNGGNSGDTTAAALARLDWVLSDRPDLAIVELGANDGLRGLDPGETYRNLDAILSRLKAEGIAVLLAGMLAPRNLGAGYVEAFDAVYPRLAEAHGVALYPFFLDGVAMQPDLNQDDGIHPNAAGVALVVARILPAVVRLIEDYGARHQAGAGDG
ncbi:MAG TPA: arylesterase [Kiloniellales bacterium]